MPTEYSDTGYRPRQSLDSATLGGLLGYFNTPAPRSSGDSEFYMSNLLRNQQYATPGPWQTAMTPEQQSAFYQWARQTQAPITPDYDMPGFYLSGGRGPGQGGHYTDEFKTPMHESFSNESKYATGVPGSPYWMGPQHDKYVPPGVPTAQQEALQAPTVDPVLSLAMGPTFGLRSMLSSLAGGALAASLGAGRTGSMLNQIPVPNLLKVTAENPYLDAMTDHMYHIAKQQIIRTMGEGGMTQGMNPEEVSEMAKEIFWHDTPDFGSMVGYRGKPAQAAENMGEIIRRMVGEGSGARPLDYPLHDVGRRLGLAALLSGFRNMPWSSQNEVPYQE